MISLCFAIPGNAEAVRDLTFEAKNTEIPVTINGELLQSPWGYGQPAANYPTFADVDSDGDKDLFIGTGDATIIFYRNEGGKRIPNFVLEDRTFLGIDRGQYIMFPTFADTDSDGDLDMYFGEWGESLNYYKNRGNGANFEYVFATGSEAVVDVKNFPAPEFVDIDGDSDLDMFVGNFEGHVFFYENAGDPENPQFVLTSNQYNEMDFNEVAVPRFADIDGDSDLDMFVGSDNGKIAYYKNVGTSRVAEYELINDSFIAVQESQIYPAFVDIDDDSDLDLFIGNNLGEMYYFKNEGSASSPNFIKITDEYFHLDVGTHSDVNFADIDDDTDSDMFVLNGEGQLHYFKNTGSDSGPRYELQNEFLMEFGTHSHTFALKDLDNDNDMDIVVGYFDKENGEAGGGIDLYKNIGSIRTPRFMLVDNFFSGIDVGEASTPELHDYDLDGDNDLFIGNDSGTIHFYRNTGTPDNATFTFETDNFEEMSVESHSHIRFGDMDSDGDSDALLGNEHGRVFYFENVVGNVGKNFVNAGEIIEDLGSYTTITPFDADNDSRMDLFIGSEDGNVHYFNQTSTSLYPPENVTNLTAVIDKNNIMTISWNPSLNSEGDLKEYRIYERTGNGRFIGSTNLQKATSYTVINPNRYLTYGFKVTATDIHGLQNDGVEIEVKFSGANNENYMVREVSHDEGPMETSELSSVCAGFSDVRIESVSASTCDAIDFVKNAGIFTGTAEGKLELERPINRAETTKVLIEAFDFDILQPYENEFLDVQTSEWYAPYIRTAKEHGIVEGYADRTFKPGQTINKVELLKVVLEMADVDFSTTDIGLSLYDDIEATEETEWFLQYTNFAHANGLIDTVGNVLAPGEAMTRSDVIQLLYRLKQKGLAFGEA